MDALFTPGATAKVAATTTTGRVALSITGAQTVAVVNDGTTVAFIKFGDSTVTATTSDTPILGGSSRGFTPPPTATHMAAIMASGTANIYVTVGAGL